MKKIGVFICHCGTNIAGAVDVEKIREELSTYPGVEHAETYVYMCSDPGQNLIERVIKEKKLDGLVVACCSPTLHESTFRKVSERSGLNPYECEIANIREQCSWVHQENKDVATQKALKIIRSVIEKTNLNQALKPISVPITRRALVIGGGIAGIQAALDIANSGHEVLLVERSPSIGGHMIQLSETFPTLDCSQCIMTPKMVEAARHPKIKLMTYSEIQEISGYVGNFKVKILRKPKYVIEDKCTMCAKCVDVCPVVAPSEYDRNLVPRKAIYLPFPQAIPASYLIDEATCPGFNPIACGKCAEVCEPKAIDYDMKPQIIEEKVGALVVATGYDLYSPRNLPEYGGGKLEDVLDGLQFERLLSATGPTGGEVRRLSDFTIPKRVVFISCAGSRDEENHMPYCSKVCCMYLAKHAMLYRHKVHGGEPIIFYIDIRAGGKGYEEFVARAQKEENVSYVRGKVSKIYRTGNGKLVVLGADTLLGRKVEIECDMVVLGTAMVPSEGIRDLISKLKIQTDPYGFVSEAHPKLRPVESISAGFFIAGAAQAPKDIPEAVAQASGAASKVIGLFASPELTHEPIVATVNEDLCSGCGMCIAICPYGARELVTEGDHRVARVREIECEGCRACIVACPSGASSQKNYQDDQLYRMMEAILRE